MSDILLINPSYRGSYGGAKASIVNPIFPTLAIGTVAAAIRQKGHRVHILDLSWKLYDHNEIREKIHSIKPDMIAMTGTTPNMNQVRDISVLAKDISQDIRVIVGGPHASALPEITLKESLVDIVVVGEGDRTIGELCDGNELKTIDGLVYRNGDGFITTKPRRPIENLDELPMPAWDLYDLNLYAKYTSRLFAKRVPFVTAEFSRGCVYKCDFCASKMTMALGYRKKSPERCKEEVQYMHKLGIREFMLTDDIFTSDTKWATKVSEAITSANTGIAWTCTNGIRVESAVPEMFQVMRKAGCYRVSFGFESGNDEVLKQFGKGGRACLQKGREAVLAARKSKIDTNGYFMLGLSSDDDASMEDTIQFARGLPLDMLKFGVTIAFPGTPMFNNYVKAGLIKSFNWDHYHMYSQVNLFAHPKLEHQNILNAAKKAYRVAILMNPKFIIRRMMRGVRTGEFFWDAYYFLKFLFLPSLGSSAELNYYARDRWPVCDFKESLPISKPPLVALPSKKDYDTISQTPQLAFSPAGV